MYTYGVSFISESRHSFEVYVNADTRKEAIDKAKDMWYSDHFDRMYDIKASKVKDESFVKEYNEFKMISY